MIAVYENKRISVNKTSLPKFLKLLCIHTYICQIVCFICRASSKTIIVEQSTVNYLLKLHSNIRTKIMLDRLQMVKQRFDEFSGFDY
jgi:hypothetical protein